MPKNFIFLIIGLFFGFGGGFLVAATSGAQMETHDHGDPAHHAGAVGDHGGDHTGMDHSKLTEAGSPTPNMTLMLHPDGVQSRNLHIGVSDFAFAPEAVNGTHVPGQGHAHIYVNGIKIARAYGPWFHLSALPKGEHEIRVTLNANDHSQLALDDVPVEATAKLVIE